MALGRVLVVDDEPRVGSAFRDMLQQIGYLARTVTEGREALELIDVFLPDVVLLDLNMPGMPGTEVLEQLRQRHPEVRVIIVTANDDVALAQRTLAGGAFDYVVKPFTLEGLERIVGAAIGHRPA